MSGALRRKHLGNMGGSSKEVLQALLAALKDKDADVRKSVAKVLGKLEVGSSEAIQALIAALKDKNEYVRMNAAKVLVKIGVGSNAALEAMLAAPMDKNDSVRSSAAEVLGKIGGGNSEAIEGLIAALMDKNDSVRSSAADALGKIGTGSPEALQGLLAAPKDQGGYVRSSAADALGKIGANSAELFSLTVASKVRDYDTIALLYGKLPTSVFIQCFARSGIEKCIEKLLNATESCCLTLEGNTLSIQVQQKTEKITLTPAQITSLLYVFKNHANKKQLTQLANVYDSYLAIMNNPNFFFPSNK